MTKDWTALQKKFKGQWVALMDDEETVVGFGRSAREAWEKAKKTGCPNPILSHMPEELVTYVGFGV